MPLSLIKELAYDKEFRDFPTTVQDKIMSNVGLNPAQQAEVRKLAGELDKGPRGLLQEAGYMFPRAIGKTEEMAGKTLQALSGERIGSGLRGRGEEWQARYAMDPKNVEEHPYITRGMSALESVAPVVAAEGLALAVPPAAPVINTVALPGLYAGNTFQTAVEEGQRNGLSYDEAYRRAFVPSGIEGAGFALMGPLTRAARGLAPVSTPEVGKVALDLLHPSVQQAGKRLATGMLVDAPYMMGQGAAVSAAEKYTGLRPDADPLGELMAGAPESILTAGIFNAYAEGVGRVKAYRAAQALADPTVKQERRLAAASDVANFIRSTGDTETAERYLVKATRHIARNLPVPEAEGDLLHGRITDPGSKPPPEMIDGRPSRFIPGPRWSSDRMRGLAELRNNELLRSRTGRAWVQAGRETISDFDLMNQGLESGEVPYPPPTEIGPLTMNNTFQDVARQIPPSLAGPDVMFEGRRQAISDATAPVPDTLEMRGLPSPTPDPRMAMLEPGELAPPTHTIVDPRTAARVQLDSMGEPLSDNQWYGPDLMTGRVSGPKGGEAGEGRIQTSNAGQNGANAQTLNQGNGGNDGKGRQEGRRQGQRGQVLIKTPEEPVTVPVTAAASPAPPKAKTPKVQPKTAKGKQPALPELSEEIKNHVREKVQQLGSVEKVNEFYSDPTAPVDVYARKHAEEFYGKKKDLTDAKVAREEADKIIAAEPPVEEEPVVPAFKPKTVKRPKVQPKTAKGDTEAPEVKTAPAASQEVTLPVPEGKKEVPVPKSKKKEPKAFTMPDDEPTEGSHLPAALARVKDAIDGKEPEPAKPQKVSKDEHKEAVAYELKAQVTGLGRSPLPGEVRSAAEAVRREAESLRNRGGEARAKVLEDVAAELDKRAEKAAKKTTVWTSETDEDLTKMAQKKPWLYRGTVKNRLDRLNQLLKERGLGGVDPYETENDIKSQNVRDEIAAAGATGRVEGFYDHQTGRIGIIGEKASANRVEKILRHEMTHKGLKKIFGDGLDKALQAVHRQFRNSPDYPELNRPHDAAEEFLAKHGEQVKGHPVVKMLISKGKQLLREMGFDTKFSDSEILGLTARAQKAAAKDMAPDKPAYDVRPIGGGNIEVAPNPDDKERTEKWEALQEEDKYAITYDLSDDFLPDVLDLHGLKKGTDYSLNHVKGTYLDYVNPSVEVAFKKHVDFDTIKAAMADAGRVLGQKEVIAYDAFDHTNGQQTYHVFITAPEGFRPGETEALYKTLRKEIPDVVGGGTVKDNTLVIGNFEGIDDVEFYNKIKAVAERHGDYELDAATFRSEMFESAKEIPNGDHQGEQEQSGVRGEASREGRLSTLQSEARQRFDEEVGRRTGGKEEAARDDEGAGGIPRKGVKFSLRASEQLDLLRPAIKKDDTILKGKIGDIHGEVMRRHNIAMDEVKNWKAGFVTPRGEFLDRKAAREWVRKNAPETNKVLEQNYKADYLESSSYYEAAGVWNRGGAGWGAKLSAPMWYSKLGKVVDEKVLGKIRPAELKRMLKANGVQDAEIKQLLPHLDDLPDKAYPREEIIDVIKGNMLTYRDALLGDKAAKWEVREDSQGLGYTIYRDGVPIDSAALKAAALKEMKKYEEGEAYHGNIHSEGKVQYATWSAPGGIDYRELFVYAQMPKVSKETMAIRLVGAGELTQDGARQLIAGQLPETVEAAYRRLYRENVDEEHWSDGHSNYSQIPNPIVRVRYDTRKIGGKKILFVQEIQGPDSGNEAIMPEALRKRIYDIGVKRVLMLAHERGYAGVAWTTGEMQNKRYRQTREIKYVESKLREDDTNWFRLKMEYGAGYHLAEESLLVHESKLAEYVGEELAEKMKQWHYKENPPDGDKRPINEWYPGEVTLGGEGLKRLYDQMLPSLFKQYAKEPVEKVELKIWNPLNHDPPQRLTVPFVRVTEKTPRDYPMFSLSEGKPGIGPGIALPKNSRGAVDMRVLGPLRRLDQTFDERFPFYHHDLKPGFQQAAANLDETREDFRRAAFAPMRGKEAELAAEIIREHRGRYDMMMERQYKGLEKAKKTFDKIPGSMADKNNLKAQFIDAIQRGPEAIAKLPSELATIAKYLREERDKFLKMIQDRGRLEKTLSHKQRDILNAGKGLDDPNFIAYYFETMWKPKKNQDDATLKIIGELIGHRPLGGKASFLKPKTYPYFMEGLDHGLEPLYDNPIEMFIHNQAQIGKWIMAQDILHEYKEKGLVKFVPAGRNHPAGWLPIEGRFGTVYAKPKVLGYRVTYEVDGVKKTKSFGLKDLSPDDYASMTTKERLGARWVDARRTAERFANEVGGKVEARRESGLKIAGTYYMPENAATVINNFTSKGLRGSPVYRTVHGLNNFMTNIQLGLSAFHLGFTSTEAMVSQLAVAMHYSAFNKGRALRELLEVPVAPVSNMLLGKKLVEGWKGLAPDLIYEVNTKNGKKAYNLSELLAVSGSRGVMDDIYKTHITKKMMEAFHQGSKAGAFFRAPFALMEQSMRPIMEYWVPWQKAGVFAKLAQMEIEKANAEGKILTPEELRNKLAKISDSVDNRMGQLVYDNLFWNKTLKDSLMIALRSVGWNLGTWREIVGGVKDWVSAVGKLSKGEKPELTYRMAYTIALPVLASVLGAVTQYLLTGEGPKDMKDLFYPRTGGEDEKGNPERFSPPTYIKDIGHYMTEPFKTLTNKTAPLFSTTFDMMHNKDFWGRKIINEDDEGMQKLIAMAKYFVTNLTPFGISGAMRMNERGDATWKQVMPFVGVVPAPAIINMSEAEKLMNHYAAENRKEAGSSAVEADRFSTKGKAIAALRKKDPEKAKELLSEGIKKGLILPSEIPKIHKEASMRPEVVRFKKLTYDQAVKVMEVADDDMKKRFAPLMAQKRRTKTAALAMRRAAIKAQAEEEASNE